MRYRQTEPMNLIDIIKNGYFQQVRFLVDHGEDLDQRDSGRRTALMLCSFIEPEAWGIGISRLLIENGAKLYCRDAYGLNAFHYACIYDRTELVKVFLKALDFDLNQGDRLGNTALHYAVRAENAAVVRMIVQVCVKYKLSFDKTNNDGLTALQEAYKLNNRKCIRILENPEVLTDIGNIESNIPLDLKISETEIGSFRSSRRTISRPRSSILSRRSSKSSVLTQTESSYRRSPTIYSYDAHRYRQKELDIPVSPYEKNIKNIIQCASVTDVRNNPEFLFNLTPTVEDVAVNSHNVPHKLPRAKSAFVRRSEVLGENQAPFKSWRTELKRLYVHFQYQCTPSYRETVTYDPEAYLPFLDKPLTPSNSEHNLDEDRSKRSRGKSSVSRQGTQDSLNVMKAKPPPVPTQSKSRKVSQVMGHGGKMAGSADGALESSSESISSSVSSKKHAEENRNSKPTSKDSSTGRQSRTGSYKNVPSFSVDDSHSDVQSPELNTADLSRLRVIDE